MDITIPSGNTGISPGPVLSEFKEVNVPTEDKIKVQFG